MGIFGSEFGSLDIIAEIRLIESKVEKTIVPYHRARRKVGQSVSPEGFVAMNAAAQLLCQTLEQHHPLVIDQRRQEERLTRCLGTLFLHETFNRPLFMRPFPGGGNDKRHTLQKTVCHSLGGGIARQKIRGGSGIRRL